MRGVLLRCVPCKHQQDKLIAHLSLGCYTILFSLSIYLMFHGPRRGIGYNKPIFIISGFLFLSCSTHFALEFSHFYQVLVCANPHSGYATIDTQQTATGVQGFANETHALVGADLLISLTDFIGQLILIYRCWLLWSRNYWVIILPTLISTASLGEALMTMAASWCSPTTFGYQHVLA
jgi:hypothetical protein